jgi:hypothetical protein
VIHSSATALLPDNRERTARRQRMKPVDHVLAEDDQVIEQILDALRAAMTPHSLQRDVPGAAVFGLVLDDDACYLGHRPEHTITRITSSRLV